MNFGKFLMISFCNYNKRAF